METNELKKLIGQECLVIDPRKKKKEFEPATIKSVNVNISNKYRSDEIIEWVSYGVQLHRLSIRKNKFFPEYHKCFDVSGERIKLPDM